MTSSGPSEGIPDDFDVARLMPPSDETRKQFESVLTDLESLATVRNSKSVEVQFGNEDGYVNVCCTETEHYSALVVSASRGENRFTLGHLHEPLNEPESEIFESLVKDLTDGLDEASAEWLREACSEAKVSSDDTLLPLAVEKLLSDSPFHVNDHTTYNVHQTFNNGSRLDADWLTADEEFLKAFPVEEKVRFMHLRTSAGVEYEYSIAANGKEDLFVKKPGERAPREVETATEISFEPSEGLSIGITGSADFMRSFMAGMAERADATRQGVDKPTDSSMLEFTQALQASIKSGAA